MEHALKFVEYGAAALVFVLAVSLLLQSRNEMNMLIHSVESTVKDTNVVYESADEDISTADDIISHTELCSLLAGPLDYDVTVVNKENIVIFSKDSYNYLLFDFDSVPSATYFKRSYIYNESSMIQSVKFEAVS